MQRVNCAAEQVLYARQEQSQVLKAMMLNACGWVQGCWLVGCLPRDWAEEERICVQVLLPLVPEG